MHEFTNSGPFFAAGPTEKAHGFLCTAGLLGALRPGGRHARGEDAAEAPYGITWAVRHAKSPSASAAEASTSCSWFCYVLLIMLRLYGLFSPWISPHVLLRHVETPNPRDSRSDLEYMPVISGLIRLLVPTNLQFQLQKVGKDLSNHVLNFTL